MRSIALAFAFAAAAAAGACRPTGVGDPCTPEVEPEGGFNEEDLLLEVDSIQCRTRICMTYRMESFCTRRCESDGDCQAEWFEEGPGKEGTPPARCEATVRVGEPQLVGRYCVPERASDEGEP